MEQTQPRVIINLTLELGEDGKIHANTECDCRSRWEFESIVHYLEDIKQTTIANAKEAGNKVK